MGLEGKGIEALGPAGTTGFKVWEHCNKQSIERAPGVEFLAAMSEL
jgi:hypothetical protein